MSFTPTPVVVVPGAPAVPPAFALTPALEPIAPVLAPDRAVLGAAAVAAPVMPPVVPGVLVVDCAVEAEFWPAMLPSLEAFVCGALDGFSPTPELVEAVVPAAADPV